MTDHRDFAKAHAAAFNARTMESFSKVLEQHSSAVVEFACAMQARLDAAEALIQEIAICKRVGANGFRRVTVHVEILARLDALVKEMKERSQ